MASTRCIVLNEEATVHAHANHVSSTKYTVLSFIPQVRDGKSRLNQYGLQPLTILRL